MIAIELGNITIFLTLLTFVGLAKLISNVVNHRRLVRKYSGPKGHSMIWGHAKLLADVDPDPKYAECRCQQETNIGIIAYFRCIVYANEVR